MHEVYFATCSDCCFFALAYPADQESAQLRSWGYCARPGQASPPSASALAELRDSVLNGSRQALYQNVVGLYRSEPEDGCEYFEELVAEPAERVAKD